MAFDPLDDNTSGSTDFTLYASGIISEAFDRLQMGVEGEELTAEMFQRGLRTLNLVLRTLQSEGILLSSYEDGTLWLDPSRERYILEDVNSANTYQQWALFGAVPAGSNVIILDDEQRLNFGLYDDPKFDWYVGVLKEDNSLFWSRVETYDKLTGDLSLRDPIDGPANSEAPVFLYETPLKRIERILNLRRADNFLNDVPINQISRQEYYAQPTKYVSGIPVEAYYHRRTGKGELFIWPVPDNSLYPIKFSYERRIEDMTAPTDQLDLNNFWLEAVVNSVALRLASKYRVPAEIYNQIRALAVESYEIAKRFDDEVTDFSISFNRESR